MRTRCKKNPRNPAWATKEFKKKQKLSNQRSKELRKRATKSELEMMTLLRKAGIYFMFQKSFITGKNFCIVDFYLPHHKAIIEIDGGYHFTPEQRYRDHTRAQYLMVERNMGLLRISNDEVPSLTVDEIHELLRKTYRGYLTHSKNHPNRKA